MSFALWLVIIVGCPFALFALLYIAEMLANPIAAFWRWQRRYRRARREFRRFNRRFKYADRGWQDTNEY